MFEPPMLPALFWSITHQLINFFAMFVHSEVFQINIIIWVKAESPAEEEKQTESEKLVAIGIIILCSMV